MADRYFQIQLRASNLAGYQLCIRGGRRGLDE